jgi:short-subunit dehydrogenase
MELSGRTVLITGASGGIGQALTRDATARGAQVHITARRTDVLTSLAQETGAELLTADLADRGDVERLAERFSDVDIVVANAALPGSGALDSFAPEDLDRAIDVNLRVPMLLARLLAPKMVERGAGHLVFVSSLLGKATSPGSSVYCATKFGLRGFGQALRADLRGTGVGVSVVFPGFVSDAGMFHESGAKLPPFVRTVTPEAVAAATFDAVARDRGEVDVAPLTLRLGVKFSELAPGLAARASDRLGAHKIASQLSDGQRDKR